MSVADLNARTCHECCFSLPEGVRRIAGETTGIAKPRKNCAGRDAETETYITGGVHRRAAHPSPRSVGLIGALLHKGWSAGSGIVYLKPANAGHAARTHRLVADERLVTIREAPVCKIGRASCRERVQMSVGAG